MEQLKSAFLSLSFCLLCGLEITVLCKSVRPHPKLMSFYLNWPLTHNMKLSGENMALFSSHLQTAKSRFSCEKSLIQKKTSSVMMS